MVAATLPWVSPSKLFSLRLTTTKSTRCVVWTSRLPQRQRTMSKVALCCVPLTSRSRAEEAIANGEEVNDCPRREACAQVAKYAAKRAQLKAIVTMLPLLMRRSGMRRSRCRSCPAIRALSDSGVAARSPAASRGLRKFGLCRNKLREAAMRGDVPGLVKSSW